MINFKQLAKNNLLKILIFRTEYQYKLKRSLEDIKQVPNQ